MSDLQGSNPTSAPSATKVDKSVHEQRVTSVIPAAIKSASPVTLDSLLKVNAKMPDWYLKTAPTDRQHLKALIDERWRLQGELDELLGDLQSDIDAFGKRLLSTSLQANFNTYEDPETLSLHLYIPDNLIFGIDTGASRMRHSSLLAAALHNFEEAETQEGAFRSGSGVYRNSPQGTPQRVNAITPARFASLCRRLDIGGQYQNRIKARLEPTAPDAKQRLQDRSTASEKAAFKSSAFIARLKGDISAEAYDRLQEVIEGKENIRFHGSPLHSHRLSLMGFRTTSIVLFSAVSEASALKKAVDALTPDSVKFWTDWSRLIPFLPGHEFEKFKLIEAFFANGPTGVRDEILRNEDIYQQSRLTGPLIVYVPDDPDHPLKEYASLTEFMKALISQLRDPDYQAFFSRFVAQKDKGHFFARVNERLKTIKWQQRQPLDMGPWWRETAIENPNAQPITNLIANDLWTTLFQERRDKVINDARCIAVPTDDEDSTTRWKRLASYLDIGWNVFSFAAMLVPGMGEVVLGIMVAQMLAELAEGIEDWSKGDKEQAATYINGVLINFAQFTLMGAGHVLPRTPVALSPFVENLKPVEIDGKERLWNPDLSPYEHPVISPQSAPPNEFGLYQQGGKDVLRLDDKHYVVATDPETGLHRLKHPERPDAYQPFVEHNGAGSWKTEIDRPLEWDKTRLLRRLGTATDAVSDESLEQILTVSGVKENALRRMHVEHETPAAMLADTLDRFKVYAQAGELGEQILADRIPEALEELIPAFMTELPRWPESRGIALFDGPKLEGVSADFGNAEVTAERQIKLSRAELRAGQLPIRVIENFSETEIHELLGQGISSDKQVRINELRKRLAEHAGEQRKRVFDTLYKQKNGSESANVLLLCDTYPRLPVIVAEELLRDATLEELLHLTQKRRIPLSLREKTRAAQDRVRMSRAYEGLYLEALEDTDTRRLELASLAAMPGWSADVRIEVRTFSFNGELQASVGPEDAPIRKVLFVDETGSYHVGNLPELPEAFPRVSNLNLAGARLSAQGSNGFLRAFRQVRRLNLSGNDLRAVPEPIREMHQLERLELSFIGLVDPEPLYQSLEGLTQLQWLDLSHNNLRTFSVTRLGRLGRLERLDLRNNLLADWPVGALDAPNLRAIDLSNNEITAIPSRIYDGTHTTLLEGTNLSENHELAQPSVIRLRDYADANGRNNVLGLTYADIDRMIDDLETTTESDGEGAENGVEPDEVVSTLAENVIGQQVTPWIENIPQEEAGRYRALWQRLASEPENAAFFHLLSRMTDTEEYKVFRADLTRRIWEIMEAADSSQELRKTLFSMATTHTTCVDGRTLALSEIEVKVFEYNALRHVQPGLAQKGRALLDLSRQLFRLGEVEKLATRSMSRHADAAEVRLQYRIGLTTGWTDGLQLPGQPSHMRFARPIRGEKLTTAREAVERAEKSERFYEELITRDYWVQYLKEKYPDEFTALDQSADEKQEHLEDEHEDVTSTAYHEAVQMLEVDRTIERNQKLIELSRRETGEPAPVEHDGNQPGTSRDLMGRTTR